MKQFSIRHGVLQVGNIDVKRVAKKVGTPLYLYDASVMRAKYAELAAALPSAVKIHYSLKANPNQTVAAIFAKAGAGTATAIRNRPATSYITHVRLMELSSAACRSTLTR